jgi:hypothetical protein
MSGIKMLAIISFLGFGMIVGMVVHALYFYYRYQKTLDRKLMGGRYFDGGVLYNIICRQSLYAQAAVFPRLARLIPDVDSKAFRAISRRIRIHLIVQQMLVIGVLVSIIFLYFNAV